LKKNKNQLLLPFLLNLFFTVFEFLGGLYTNSIALISDSVHDIGDSISIGLSLVLENKSKKKADQSFTYGYRRFSLLGGLISSIVLIIGSIIIVYEAIPRIFQPETVLSTELIWFSILGVAVNLFAALKAKKGNTINQKIISLHLFEDAFGWIALFIGAILMSLFQIYWIDSILSILFTLYILSHVYKNLRQIIRIFIEVAPKNPTIQKIEIELSRIQDLENVHHVHIWTIDGENPLLTLHAVVSKGISQDRLSSLKREIHHELKHLGILHATIEIEFSGEECLAQDCDELFEDLDAGLHHHHHH